MKVKVNKSRRAAWVEFDENEFRILTEYATQAGLKVEDIIESIIVNSHLNFIRMLEGH